MCCEIEGYGNYKEKSKASLGLTRSIEYVDGVKIQSIFQFYMEALAGRLQSYIGSRFCVTCGWDGCPSGGKHA